MSRAVKSPQGADTPGVAKGPWGDETPRGPTASEDGPGEDKLGKGGRDENPPTARATRARGANDGEGGPMFRQRTEETPGTMNMAEDESSAGAQPRKSEGADGVRSKHGTLARRKYNLLASKATEGGPANAGAAGSEHRHGDLANR